MKMLFFFLGLLITFGAVGTMDYDPNANPLVQTALAFLGIAIMAVSAPKASVDQQR